MRPMVRYRCVSEVAREASMRPSPDKNPPTITTGRVPYMLLLQASDTQLHNTTFLSQTLFFRYFSLSLVCRYGHKLIHTHPTTHSQRRTHSECECECV